MTPNPYARKKRQLRFLVKNLLKLLPEQKEYQADQLKRLISKIKRLVRELKHVLHHLELKRILGAALMFMGLTLANEVSAQKFTSPKKNPFGLTSVLYIASPAVADLDGDGDLDLLVGEFYGTMQYFKNVGTKTIPQFAAPQKNPFGLVTTYYLAAPTFADLDNDGDLDLIVGEGDGAMQYFKNTGSSTLPQFAAPIRNPFGLSSTYHYAHPAFVDLDGDGDFDLLVGEDGGPMQYFKNTGTKTTPQFAAPVKNPFGLSSTNDYAMPAFADLDIDGDMDLLVGEDYGAMQYFKNTGSKTNPQFAAPQLNPFGLDSAYVYAWPAFADLDGDGDMDLLVGEGYGSIQYFENLPNVGIITNKNEFNVKLYPNPIADILFIDGKESVERLEIINTLGQTVVVFEKPTGQISLKELTPGTYAIKILDTRGNVSVKKITKE